MFLAPDELGEALTTRAIDDAAVRRALGVLSRPDPAGLVSPPSLEQVAHVAVYLHPVVGGSVRVNPIWRLIEFGHPAAHAVYWHELQELDAYRHLTVVNPLTVHLGGATYWQAHAWASWREAEYWATWAAAEGQVIDPTAFLRAHPLRQTAEDAEIQLVVEILRDVWGVVVVPVSVLELERANRFYHARQLTPREVGTWRPD